MYDENRQPIPLTELNLRQFITFQENGEDPLIKVRFSLDTAHLKKDFNLDLIIWNLTDDNLEQTEKVVRYVLRNFSKLFETGWTTFYHNLCRDPYSEVSEHTVDEFFREQIDFDSPYYSIQLELNCAHLKDGQARYCFVVATPFEDWVISDDDIRIYMNGNKACGFNDNNDDCQMQESLELCDMFYGYEIKCGYQPGELLSEEYRKMVENGFLFAEPFQ